jgi:DNA-binding NarL/FixJ family response regulator
LHGAKAARLLRDKCPATSVIMLSMHSNSEHVFRALEAGAAGFVLKESAGEEVAAAVRAAHAGQRYLSRAIAALESTVQSRPGRVSPLDRLRARERHVLQLVVEERSGAEIAATVSLSPKTIETYRGRLMKKLSVNSVADLVNFP